MCAVIGGQRRNLAVVSQGREISIEAVHVALALELGGELLAFDVGAE